jgi:hypothetical protein
MLLNKRANDSGWAYSSQIIGMGPPGPTTMILRSDIPAER